MRRYFYVSDFWDVPDMEQLKKTDSTKYAIAKESYKLHPMFIVSEDETLSNYLAPLEEKIPYKFLMELKMPDALIEQYYRRSDGLQIIGNENILKDSSML